MFQYLHSQNIIHRDLKVQNVFLDANMNCKLGDLGIARYSNHGLILKKDIQRKKDSIAFITKKICRNANSCVKERKVEL